MNFAHCVHKLFRVVDICEKSARVFLITWNGCSLYSISGTREKSLAVLTKWNQWKRKSAATVRLLFLRFELSSKVLVVFSNKNEPSAVGAPRHEDPPALLSSRWRDPTRCARTRTALVERNAWYFAMPTVPLSASVRISQRTKIPRSPSDHFERVTVTSRHMSWWTTTIYVPISLLIYFLLLVCVYYVSPIFYYVSSFTFHYVFYFAMPTAHWQKCTKALGATAQQFGLLPASLPNTPCRLSLFSCKKHFRGTYEHEAFYGTYEGETSDT